MSYWTVSLLGLALLGLHAWWFAACRAMPRGEVIGGFGAALVVLGVLVAARPYIRAGVAGMARAQVSPPAFGFYTNAEVIADVQAVDRAKVEAAMPDVRAERVVAVLVVLAGTVVNGYAGPITRGLAAIFRLGDCP